MQDYSESKIADHSALGTRKNFPIEFSRIIYRKKFNRPIVFELSFE